MRLAPIAPRDLSPQQLALHNAMKASIEKHLGGFIWQRADGALIGPFNPLLHFPQFGEPMLELFRTMSEYSTLPKHAHEVSILVPGARFNSQYELYSHEFVAARIGLSPEKIATIVAGERPGRLKPRRECRLRCCLCAQSRPVASGNNISGISSGIW
jgi:4-carboxymuconolactone decarboxylase